MSDIDALRPAPDSPAGDFEIDWTKEPATQRERRIRAALLRNALADRPTFVTLILKALLSESTTKCFLPEDAASDFREAYVTGKAMFDEASAKMARKRIEQAIREVDGAHE